MPDSRAPHRKKSDTLIVATVQTHPRGSLSPPNSPSATPRDWAGIARDYAAGALTIAEICALYGVSTSAIYQRAALEGWKKRGHAARASRHRNGAASMTERLLSALDRKMTEFETRIAQCATTTAADSERDARTLNTLVRLFEKLKGSGGNGATDAKAAAAPVPAATSAGKDAHDADRLRHDLARRLEKLRGGLCG